MWNQMVVDWLHGSYLYCCTEPSDQLMPEMSRRGRSSKTGSNNTTMHKHHCYSSLFITRRELSQPTVTQAYSRKAFLMLQRRRLNMLV
mmetsp:Transcript_39300/g.71524  ORF Transcript_39300/g.71524 Transcript_39300/m.71524 type:complete len:88 (-) Transcript_39300:58-321(-)